MRKSDGEAESDSESDDEDGDIDIDSDGFPIALGDDDWSMALADQLPARHY